MLYQPTLEEAQANLNALAESFSDSASDWLKSAEFHQRNRIDGAGLDYEARYKALIDHIPAIIFVAPLEAGLGDAYISPQVESILGFTQEEWLGDPLRWYQQVHPDDKQRWSLEAASLFLSGEPLSSNYRVLARDGRVVWFQCDARMVHSNDGKPSFIHGIGFDVTELKETEASLKTARDELETRIEERTEALALINTQLKEEITEHKRTEIELIAAKELAESAAKTKTEFLANMSHEIRTPMNGVLGMLNLVLETGLSTEQVECLSAAKSSAESLLDIINQVLDFSKVESGKSQLNRANFRLRSSLGILLNELRYSAEQKALDLTFAIAPEIPEILIGDLGRLRQVLTNLIGNAIKFTESGRVFLQVTLEQSLERDHVCTVRFSIVDTGIGIPSAKIKLIFEPFTQADGSITREYGGTGLGLSISKELVEMMNGQLQVVSEPGRGSTFSFTARFGTMQAETHSCNEYQVRQVPSEAVPEENPDKLPFLQILVAEDNPINQKVVSRIIEKSGHAVTLAQNGHEALEAYSKFSFNLALMDVQMPLMDGLSATAAIRSMEAQQGSSRLPIIGLTAHALKADLNRCLEAGMDGYLSKPFKKDELIRLIEELAMRGSEGADPTRKLAGG